MPHDLPLLGDLLLLLLASMPIAFIFHRLRLPTIVGFMITGIVIGPYGFGFIRDVHAIDVLAEIGIARNVIQRQVEGVRSEAYQMLRAPSLPHVQMSEIAEALAGASTETLVIGAVSSGVGKTIGDLMLRSKTGTTVIAVVRDGQTDINPGSELRLRPEDVLVLLGSPEQIDRAIEHINAS